MGRWSKVSASPTSEVNGFADIQLEMPVLKSELDAREFGAPVTWWHTSPTEVIMAFIVSVAEDVA
eukprot:12907750-Prorocentrum_lima.AAC.1